MSDLLDTYKKLINVELPQKYQHPVRYNHCFARIILDWLFDDCWYNHLDRKKNAGAQLTDEQLQRAITRMQLWLQTHDVLISDNQQSLVHRRKYADIRKA
ncbi:hypothetical protein EXU57_09560 [Segetibacter sp. 3557_3]|uniref:hypothetical protein n=1 Tax=Segetibacter sp. 3557_3 TaxID=2547429 RepID=UPI00105913EC|nr:hypothetical protein [Segetibacter sp. 3557_3]TDH27034.1 hypothetical protein EXU57_09560 [Segetibacter sp. 3557_3]